MLGPRHASVQRLRRLSGRRAARLEEGRFVIDGPTLLADALAAGIVVEEVFTAGEPLEVVALAAEAGAVVREVRPDVLARATDTVTSQGVAAVAARFDLEIDDAMLAAAASPLSRVRVVVSDTGNARPHVRVAEAAGAAAVLFCGSSVDPSNAKCVRASAGAVFHVPVASGGDVGAVMQGLGDVGVQRAAAVVRGGLPYHVADLTGPVAFVLGSEAHGLPEPVLEAVDLRVTIPMAGRSESLNVAMAGSVLCFESLRQRRAAG